MHRHGSIIIWEVCLQLTFSFLNDIVCEPDCVKRLRVAAQCCVMRNVNHLKWRWYHVAQKCQLNNLRVRGWASSEALLSACTICEMAPAQFTKLIKIASNQTKQIFHCVLYLVDNGKLWEWASSVFRYIVNFFKLIKSLVLPKAQTIIKQTF